MKTRIKDTSRKHSDKPSFGDQPWQNPQYGQEEPQEDLDAQNQDDSCGCAGSPKEHKKSQVKK